MSVRERPERNCADRIRYTCMQRVWAGRLYCSTRKRKRVPSLLCPTVQSRNVHPRKALQEVLAARKHDTECEHNSPADVGLFAGVHALQKPIIRRLKKASHIRKKCYDSLPFLTQMLCPDINVPNLSEGDKQRAIWFFKKLDSAYCSGEPFVSYLYALEYILGLIGRQDVLPYINKISCRKRRADYKRRLQRIFSSSRCRFV